MLRPGDRVVVGLSGGADSVCLLHALHGLKAYKLTLNMINLKTGIIEWADEKPILKEETKK